MTDDDCPNYGTHKYFTYVIKTDYEPFGEPGVAGQLYLKVEYAILSCNCSSVVRVRVKKQ